MRCLLGRELYIVSVLSFHDIVVHVAGTSVSYVRSRIDNEKSNNV